MQARGPFGAVAGDPLARGAVTDPGRLGGRAQRPLRILNPSDQQLAALQTEPGVRRYGRRPLLLRASALPRIVSRGLDTASMDEERGHARTYLLRGA